MKKIFITGVYRSGTTLLEKVLNSHPNVNIFSQPISPLFITTKKKFLEFQGVNRDYPIGPDFMDDTFQDKELDRFLKTQIIDSKVLGLVFDKIQDEKSQFRFSGKKFRSKVKAGIFLEVFEKSIELLNLENQKLEIEYLGAKEIICEEFLPHLINNGIKSILIIRDPRDILCSLNFGKGKEFTGEIRPLLYTLRLWRKSVAYAINLNKSSGFMFIRYEDLASDPEKVLNKISSFLNLSPIEKRANFVDNNQEPWKGNSSFADYNLISSEPVGRYKKLLDKDTIRYIENVCYPEMKYTGYDFENADLDIQQIKSYKEPFAMVRKNFPSDFSISEENTEMEIRRIHSLKREASLSESEQRSLFLFPEVYKEFKNL